MRYLACVLLLGACGDDAPVRADGAGECVPAQEVCNNVDDNCNGVADEDCPCKPFMVETPAMVDAPVSTGSGWAGVARPTLPNVNSTMIVISDSGAVGATTELPDTSQAWSNLAWDGDELVYLASSATDAYLAFIKPDGTGLRAGPARGEPSGYSPFVRFHGNSYQVGYPHGNQLVYAVTDSTEVWRDERVSSSINQPSVLGIDTIGSTVYASWLEHLSPGAGNQAHLGEPWSLLASTVGSASQGAGATLASNGTFALVSSYGDLYRYDGTSLVRVEGVPLPASSIMWTQDRWVYVRSTDAGFDIVTLDTGLSVTSMSPVTVADRYRTAFAADQQHALLTVEIAPEGVPHQYYAIQRCLY